MFYCFNPGLSGVQQCVSRSFEEKLVFRGHMQSVIEYIIYLSYISSFPNQCLSLTVCEHGLSSREPRDATPLQRSAPVLIDKSAWELRGYRRGLVADRIAASGGK